MRFLLGPLILIAGLFALLRILADMFPYALSDGDDQMRFVVLGFLLGLLLFSLIGGIPRPVAKVAQYSAMWIAAVFGVVLAYSYKDYAPDIYDRLRSQFSPSIAVVRTDDSVELRRAWDGHFRALADVQGTEVSFLFDTGASTVVLRYEDAEAIGFDMDELRYTIPVTTANGKGRVAPVRIDYLRVGAVRIPDMKAVVAEPGKLQESLLGMTFFNRISETTFSKNRLILRQ
jgi:aspartyl protease family protein